eukprot:300499-Rhodomonas_salina.2
MLLRGYAVPTSACSHTTYLPVPIMACKIHRAAFLLSLHVGSWCGGHGHNHERGWSVTECGLRGGEGEQKEASEELASRDLCLADPNNLWSAPSLHLTHFDLVILRF